MVYRVETLGLVQVMNGIKIICSFLNDDFLPSVSIATASKTRELMLY